MARRPGATVTKADLAEVVHQRIGGFSKRQAAELVDLVFETMKETLGRGEEVKISGYGNFSPRDKQQRRGRNPQTGEAMPISERRVLSFKASKLLRAALNALASRAVAAALSAGGHP
jgi:integration host factor subunit alpha